jgi:hypothetical protein
MPSVEGTIDYSKRKKRGSGAAGLAGVVTLPVKSTGIDGFIH